MTKEGWRAGIQRGPDRHLARPPHDQVGDDAVEAGDSQPGGDDAGKPPPRVAATTNGRTVTSADSRRVSAFRKDEIRLCATELAAQGGGIGRGPGQHDADHGDAGVSAVFKIRPRSNGTASVPEAVGRHLHRDFRRTAVGGTVVAGTSTLRG